MNNKKQIAVILSGSGVFDGSEIHEATLTLYSIAKNGAEYMVFAPDIDQHHVINHITGEEMPEKRNVLVESARIARGNIKSLDDFNANDYDGIIFPGGFGAAKNLSTYAFDGAECKVNPKVESIIKQMAQSNKPIGALCISPVIIAKVLDNVDITIGQDTDTAEAIQKMGSNHIKTNHGEVTIDKRHKVVTTPCYMLDATIDKIGEGADNVIKSMIKLME